MASRNDVENFTREQFDKAQDVGSEKLEQASSLTFSAENL
jgi:hypothetical protein